MERNTDLWDKAKLTALKVEFLTSYEELFLYASAIYFATIWGKEVDERNDNNKHVLVTKKKRE